MEHPSPSEVDLLEGTCRDIEEAIDRLKEQRKLIDEELREKSERLLAWKTRLAKIQTGEEINPKTRRQKGENLKTISALFLKQDSAFGLAASQIAKATSLSWSSVRVVLNGKPDLFRESGGLWYMNKEAIDANEGNKNGDGKGIAP